jgi:hypothetical protein
MRYSVDHPAFALPSIARRANARRGLRPIDPPAIGHLFDEGRQFDGAVALVQGGAAFGDATALVGLQQALQAGAEAIDLADPDAGADTLVLGEAGARELIVLLGMLVGDEDGRYARKQQLMEGIVANGADHEVKPAEITAEGKLAERSHALRQLDRLLGDRPFRHLDVGLVASRSNAMAVRRNVA